VNNNNLAYLTAVQMGTPPQLIQMAPSLSQNQISVASAPEGVSDSSFYNPTASTSHIPGSASATIPTISGGSITGQYAGETCTIQSSTNSLSFTYNASVVLTDAVIRDDLYPPGARAVLGYGVNAPADSPAGASLLGSFLPANFTSAVCGIELNSISDPVPDGFLTMGAVDTSAFTGDFTNVMVPADSTISWAIPFDNFRFLANGTNQTVSGSLASVDIYHPGIQVTNDVASQIYAGIPQAKALSETLWSIPCNTSFALTLTFAGKPFTMSERDTLVKQADGSCTGVVTGGAAEIGKVGAPFLRTVYTQFGAEKDASGTVSFSVGFATKQLRQTVSTTATTTKPKTTVTSPTSTVSTNPSSGAQTRMAVHSLPMMGLAVISVVAVILL
jgi:hypothetical protein